jgi:hypothetical protein
MPKIKNMGTGTMRFSEGLIVSGSAGVDNKAFVVTGSIAISGSESITALGVYSSISNQYVATIDNDAGAAGHVLKLSTDGNGSGTRILEMEDGDGDIIFRARADGRFGFGPDGVDSMGAGTFVVGIDNSSHTSDIAISRRMQHLGDGNTYIDFPANDQMQFQVGGIDMIHMTEDGSQDKIVFNNGAADVDFIVESPNEPLAIYLHAGNEVLHINHNESGFKTKIHSTHGEGVTVNEHGVIINEDGHATNDFRIESDTNDYMFFVDSGNNKVGINTSVPASTLSIMGSLALKVHSINAANDPGTSYSISTTDCVLLINTRPTAQGGIDSAITLTLPDASDNPGMVLTIKDAAGYCDVNAITITASSGDNIDGNPLTTSMNLPTPASWKKLISDGANSWYEIGS